jgi:hypothetical protein
MHLDLGAADSDGDLATQHRHDDVGAEDDLWRFRSLLRVLGIRARDVGTLVGVWVYGYFVEFTVTAERK